MIYFGENVRTKHYKNTDIESLLDDVYKVWMQVDLLPEREAELMDIIICQEATSDEEEAKNREKVERVFTSVLERAEVRGDGGKRKDTVRSLIGLERTKKLIEELSVEIDPRKEVRAYDMARCLHTAPDRMVLSDEKLQSFRREKFRTLCYNAIFLDWEIKEKRPKEDDELYLMPA